MCENGINRLKQDFRVCKLIRRESEVCALQARETVPFKHCSEARLL